MKLTAINAPGTHHHGGYHLKDVLAQMSLKQREVFRNALMDDGYVIMSDANKPTSITVWESPCMCGVLFRFTATGEVGAFINLLDSRLRHARKENK